MQIGSGAVLVMDNQRVVHGRTAHRAVLGSQLRDAGYTAAAVHSSIQALRAPPARHRTGKKASSSSRSPGRR
jgi:hypothetical protein